MEEILLRFPLIGENIFKKLSNKNLIKCKKVGKTWERFIINEKFYKLKVKYEKIQKHYNKNGETPLHEAAKNGQ